MKCADFPGLEVDAIADMFLAAGQMYYFGFDSGSCVHACQFQHYLARSLQYKRAQDKDTDALRGAAVGGFTIQADGGLLLVMQRQFQRTAECIPRSREERTNQHGYA